MRDRAAHDLLRLRAELFGDATVLLRCLRDTGGCLFDLLHGGDDLGEPACRSLGNRFDAAHFGLPYRHRGRHLIHLLADHARRARDVLRGAGGLVGELAHFFGDDGEAPTMLARAGGLDRRIEGQQVGL